jgi:hypothetical protein
MESAGWNREGSPAKCDLRIVTPSVKLGGSHSIKGVY